MGKSDKKWAIISVITGVFAAVALILTICLYFKKEEILDEKERQYTEIEL